ncbi:FAD binding domain protein [Massariosphaeria phaeospora]|uniref:FAD binding domain protein n=1 Tax=Massariosphaeria phaeospora TaxID=100035 RepID=A0A7C8MG30_9PLEO|nr:FAD binding domain protein [Massariosphaeria phaeospora]
MWLVLSTYLATVLLPSFQPVRAHEHGRPPHWSFCCLALSVALPGKVSFPSSPAYTASTSSYWSLQESTIQPSCILTPLSALEVATAVKTLSILSHVSGCPFAIRGGGHTPWAGSANIDGGITIDMRQINAITVNSQKTTASIGAGAIWGEVYRRMDKMGLAVVGGRGASIGVGGLTTGGGISYFSARKGFACDNVLNFEVVLADGRILALQGGSNNFGLVTRFDVTAFPQSLFWGGSILYDDSASPQLLKGFTELNKDQNFDEFAALIQSHAYVPGRGFVATANMEYTKQEANSAAFETFVQAQPQFANTMRISNLTDFTVEFVSMQPNGLRQMYITITFKNDFAFLTYVYDTFKKTVSTQLSATSSLAMSLTFQPLPPAITSKSGLKGGNVMGLNPSDGAQVLFIRSTGKAVHDEMVREAKARGVWNRWIYLNYADGWQGPIGSYGEANLRFLQEVSRKYDPKGVFQKQVPGGLKLFK